MPAMPWFPVRTISGEFRDSKFKVPYSSLPPGSKFVDAPFVVPTMSAGRKPGLAGAFQQQTFMQPPFFTNPGPGMGGFTMPSVDDAVAWVKKNALLVVTGVIGLALFTGRRRR